MGCFQRNVLSILSRVTQCSSLLYLPEHVLLSQVRITISSDDVHYVLEFVEGGMGMYKI